MNRNPLQIAIVEAAKTKRRVEWGEILNGFKVFACHQAQLDVLASKAKFTFAFAGSGGGKTCLIPVWIYKQLNEARQKGIAHPRILVVSPSVPTFESSQLKQHILTTFDGTIYSGEWREGKKTYDIKTGGEIVVKTVGDGSDYSKLIGGQYYAAVADECYELDATVWAEIRRRVSNSDGRILAVTTPTGNNWIWEAKDQADKGNADFYVRHWSKLDNPTVSREDVERERGLVNDATFQRMVMGQFSALEGLIYTRFSDPNAPEYPVLKGDPFERLPAPPVKFFGGNDWGYNPDPACMLMFVECEDGNTYAVDEVYGTGITPDDLSVKARALIDKWSVRVDSKYADMIQGGRFSTFWTDVSRPEQTVMFRNVGVPIKNKRVTDIVASVALTDQWFQAGRLFVFEKACPNLARELRGYQWDANRRGGLKDTPKGGNDHACDALRYAISSQKYGQTITKAQRSALDEDTELKKAIGLGLLTEDPALRLKEISDQKAKERFSEMAYGNADDDDPFGVWS